MWLLVASCIFAAAVAAIAAVEWQYQRHWKYIESAGNPAEVSFTRFLFLLCLLFERRRAQWVASFCDIELPCALRVPILRLVALVMGADTREVKHPLRSYRSIGDFFARELREGARPVQPVPGGLFSPVDARVLALGEVSSPSGARVAQVEVKGTTFSLAGLLGSNPTKAMADDNTLMYVAFHLGPGDYHRFHSPADFVVREGRRFAGEGLPVSPVVTGRACDVFSVNERVVLSGMWEGDRPLHLVAVGAAHVRGIFLDFDTRLCKDLGAGASDGLYYLDGQATRAERSQEAAASPVPPGAQLGGFRLGSAVVLVLEAPKGSRWLVNSGDRVRVGEQILAGEGGEL
eukprot:TRINITY_DN14145_c0_g2_i2.p1 TRINITY_DN14145_c0_g2~~TRINITY_DN14145_c0_g2_i2.p1  ORF type:complete len:346 (+),score=57.78 TRINITY_DN14145_c0_g2_i2:148-1185(+)